MLDPECADITARILELLGQEGYSLEDPRVKKAIQFLRDTQEEDGSWYGRWGVNYIYGTWAVLRGLRSIGLDMNQPWMRRARRWLEQVQNDDGGWGERCNTYDDPIYKGQGPSTASQTAWAVMALQAFGEPDADEIRLGVDYLLNTQNHDGSWDEDETTGTGFPKVFYLKYDSYRNAWPLLALAEQRDLEKLLQARDGKRKTSARQELAGPAR
jgi:squalene-hopene/tetraprenyl-beta-curcumene cyclase